MTKSHKTLQFWIDCSDKRHTLFHFKYIQLRLQTIKKTILFLTKFPGKNIHKKSLTETTIREFHGLETFFYFLGIGRSEL